MHDIIIEHLLKTLKEKYPTQIFVFNDYYKTIDIKFDNIEYQLLYVVDDMIKMNGMGDIPLADPLLFEKTITCTERLIKRFNEPT